MAVRWDKRTALSGPAVGDETQERLRAPAAAANSRLPPRRQRRVRELGVHQGDLFRARALPRGR
eukprot:4663703-Pyramimonas_sp.AAC.1